MTKKKRFWIYINEEVYEKYKEIVLSKPNTSINFLYKYIADDIKQLDDALQQNQWNAKKSKTLIDYVNNRYPSTYKRKVITADDDMYYHIQSMRRRGYDITGYVNYAMYCKVRYYEEH